IGNLRRALGGRHLAECSGGARPEQWFTSPCFHQRGWRVLHCSRVEAVSSREKKNAKFGITNARGIFQYGLEYRLQLTARARDDAQHLCGRRLLLQRLGKVPRASASSRLYFSSCCSRSAPGLPVRPARVLTVVPVERRPRVWPFVPLRDKVTPRRHSHWSPFRSGQPRMEPVNPNRTAR